MTRNEVVDKYFDWMVILVCGQRYSKHISYDRLLADLHNMDFIWIVANDGNRASDGAKLRRRFALRQGFEDDSYICECLDGPCSMLEMMVALAIRCEETIMDDPLVGDRTGQWFWGMIVSLGLGSMIDSRYDRDFVRDVIDRFLHRDYEPDGTGGLFKINGCKHDLRKVEIWIQLLWYLDNIV